MTVEENGSKATEFEKRCRELEQELMRLNPLGFRPSRRIKTPISQRITEILNSSPRKLLTTLQEEGHSPNAEKKARNSIRFMDKTPLEDRRDTINRSRIKGKRLQELLDNAADISMGGINEDEEVCSVCSSVLDQESEPSSSGEGPTTTATATTEAAGRDDKDGEVMMVKAQQGVGLAVGEGEGLICDGGGGKWLVRMGWLAVFMLVVALGIICLAGLDGGEEYDDRPVPT